MSKTNKPHRFRLALVDKFNLKDPNKNVALANLRIHYTLRIIKSASNNTKFKISTSTQSNEFDLPYGSYSVLDIQDYFECIIKKIQHTMGPCKFM